MSASKRLLYANNLRAGPIQILPPGTGTAVIGEDGSVLTDENGNVILTETKP